MDVALPIALAIGLWWLTTILLLWRMRLAPATFPATMIVATVAGAAGCAGFWYSLGMDGTLGAYVAFSSALAIWCWHETGYFLGYVTGPRPQGCPPGATRWQRFRFGVRASLYHAMPVRGVRTWAPTAACGSCSPRATSDSASRTWKLRAGPTRPRSARAT